MPYAPTRAQQWQAFRALKMASDWVLLEWLPAGLNTTVLREVRNSAVT